MAREDYFKYFEVPLNVEMMRKRNLIHNIMAAGNYNGRENYFGNKNRRFL